MVIEMKNSLGFRMKKLIVFGMGICLLLALTACGKEEQNSGLTAIDPSQSAGSSTGQDHSGGEGTLSKDDGWDVAAILAEGYYNTEYREYFVGGISFALDEDAKTATATSTYTIDTTEYYMPDEFSYEGTQYKVTGSEDGVFSDGDATRVRLSGNLTKVPDSMFYGCEELTEVVIPEGVTEISDSAFTLCSALQYVKLPKTLKKIGAEAFFGCGSLTGLVIPDGVSEIGESAFYECSLLKEIVFPAALRKIPDEALSNCVCLEKVVIPQGVGQIGYEVFWGCSALKEVEIPDSVVLMGTRVFYDCSALEKITLPANLMEVDAEMFSFCEKLKQVNASATVAELLQDEMPVAEFEIVIR